MCCLHYYLCSIAFDLHIKGGSGMETFGIIGMTFGSIGMGLGVTAYTRLEKLERQLKKSGVLGKDY